MGPLLARRGDVRHHVAPLGVIVREIAGGIRLQFDEFPELRFTLRVFRMRDLRLVPGLRHVNPEKGEHQPAGRDEKQEGETEPQVHASALGAVEGKPEKPLGPNRGTARAASAHVQVPRGLSWA